MTKEHSPTAAKNYQSVLMFSGYQQIYVKRARGRFDNWRVALVVLTQLLFYGTLWLEWNGRQAVLFHLVERKFYIFGLVFWPQDVIYLTVALLISAYLLFLAAAVAGRLFCGYACPQTVYTQIFMWVENWIEGERNARIKLDKSPMTARKLRLKVSKHALWLIIALWTGITFVGYFSPVRELFGNLRSFDLGGWEIFWIFFYAGFTYLLAGHMRELVCRHMCPYARFQSAMFDPDTLIITYDKERGEPRNEPAARKAGAVSGDCVDCGLCVRVCPTGIDIRDGLQYECIGCASCIDVCDEVMDKIGKPRGLVRYSTENAMAKHYSMHDIVGHIARPRVLGYASVLVLVVIIAATFLAIRIPLKVDVIRDRSVFAREVEDGRIENVYTLTVINTEERAHRYRFSVEGLAGIAIDGPTEFDIGPATTQRIIIPVRVPPDAGTKGSNPIRFNVVATDNPALHLSEKATLMLP